MICDQCLRFLTNRLSKEAKFVLESLGNKPQYKSQLLKLGIGEAVLTKALVELSTCGFVRIEEDGRSKVYHLTDVGVRALEKPPKTEAIVWKDKRLQP